MTKRRNPLIGLQFELKCACCGHVEKRPAKDCEGNEPPPCSKCLGPMLLERVTKS